MIEEQDKDKPLVPRTAAGAAIIGVPLASILAFGGWAGQKLLSIDEQLIQVRQEQANRKTVVEEFRELMGKFAEVETRVERHASDLRNAGVELLEIDERLVRVETKVDDLHEEQQSLRERLRDLNINTRFRQTGGE